MPDALHESIHFLQRVVKIEACSAGYGNTQSHMQRHRTVMPHSDCNPATVQNFGYLLTMDAIDRKG